MRGNLLKNMPRPAVDGQVPRLFQGQTGGDELRSVIGGRWIDIRQDGDDVARARADLQVPIHAGGAASVAEAMHSAEIANGEPVAVVIAAGTISVAGDHHFGVRRVQQFVIFQSQREME